MSEFKNVKPVAGGKVHKVGRWDAYTGVELMKGEGHPDYGQVGRACEKFHNPYKVDLGGWFGPFMKTDEPITCGNCLKMYWPDGRGRV